MERSNEGRRCDNQTCNFKNNFIWNDTVHTSSSDVENESNDLHSSTMQNLKNSELNKTLFYPAESEHVVGLAMDTESFLVDDTYDPGLIEDSVECRKDFNAVSFGLFFENTQNIPKELPPMTPMSLIEAFHRRIDLERKLMLQATSSMENARITRSESIDTYFSNKPQTNLNLGLKNLYKAEALYEAEKVLFKEAADVPYEVKLQYVHSPLADTYFGQTSPLESKKKSFC